MPQKNKLRNDPKFREILEHNDAAARDSKELRAKTVALNAYIAQTQALLAKRKPPAKRPSPPKRRLP